MSELRSGVSFWEEGAANPRVHPVLTSDLRCDVLVVGGGISGALIANALVEKGVDVVLIDRDSPAEGSTAASTGLLQYETDTSLSDLISKLGERRAVRAYELGRWAIDEIARLCAELPGECGFSRRPSYYVASHFWHARRLRKEFRCRKKFGFNVEWYDKARLREVSTWSAACALRSEGDAQINPLAFTREMLARAETRGLRIYGGTKLINARVTADTVEAETTDHQITARRLVIATGYEASRFIGEKKGRFHSTYALASEPVENFDGWPEGALLWETARPYFYARQTDDRRVIVGGGDTMFSSDQKRGGLVERKIERLVREFEYRFPRIRLVPEFRWAGTFAETEDGLAFIGEHPDHPSTYFALGYGGNGITFSAIAAKIITDLHLGVPSEDAAVFAFRR